MARRKKQSSQPALKAKQSHKKSTGLVVAVVVTIVLAGIPFGLGKYIELNSPGPFDSGSYVYSAKHLLSGARLGIEEQPSAEAGTLIANIIGVKLFGFNDTGPKIVQMMLQLAAGIFMFYTLRRVFGSVAAVVGTTLAALYLSAPLIAKFGNVKEQFMIAFMIYAGCCFILFEITQKRYWMVLAGFFALGPYYFKATGISIVIAIVLYVLTKNLFSRKWKALCLEMLLFLCGYAAGLVVPGLLFLWQKKPELLLRTFPVTAFQIGASLVVFLLVIYARFYFGKIVRFSDLKKVSKSIWITGLVLIVLAFGLSVFMIWQKPGHLPEDISSYILSIPFISIPQKLVASVTGKISHAAGLNSGYLAGAWAAIDFTDVSKKIGRYYMALKLPVLLALISIIAAKIIWAKKLFQKTTPQDIQSKVVWLLALWWLLDTAFIWVSPRSYEQYYLPLCASAAMLSGYAAWLWHQKLMAAQNKMPWLAIAFIATIVMLSLSWNIFAGLPKSPDTGMEYKNASRQSIRRRGFAQSLERVNAGQKQPWQVMGDYIRSHSNDNDKIYVWGWVPGIYVQAQRLAPVPKAFESNMHVISPAQLGGNIFSLVKIMRKQPPKFIVDSRKQHIPWNRPPLELWPHTFSRKKQFGLPIPNDAAVVLEYDKLYTKLLSEKFDPKQKQYAQLPGLTCWMNTMPWTKAMPDEAQRYDAMKLLRDFVMNHYKIVDRREFGSHVLFERTTESELQKP